MADKFHFKRAKLRALPKPQSGWVYAYDDAVRGLAVGVGTTGVKSFMVYRKFKGRPIKITLGTFDPKMSESKELPDSVNPIDLLGNKPMLNVRMARMMATAVNALLDAGVNPLEAQRKQRKELTLGQLFELYIRHLESEQRRSAPLWRFYFERYLGDLPNETKKKHGKERTKPEGAVNWQRRPLSSITFEDVKRLRHALSNKPTTSNHVTGFLRAMYSFAIRERLFQGENPAIGVGKFKTQSRERYLLPDDAAKLFKALEDEPDQDIKDFFSLALYTGARRGNLMAMRWDELNLDSAIWRIPYVKMKNGEALTVPLITDAIEILRRRAENAESTEWVFPAKSRSGHLASVKAAWARLLARAGISDLHIHDLRRSLGSWMAATGANVVMTQRALGHKTIAASLIYQRLAQDPVREAMQRATNELKQAAEAKAKEMEKRKEKAKARDKRKQKPKVIELKHQSSGTGG